MEEEELYKRQIEIYCDDKENIEYEIQSWKKNDREENKERLELAVKLMEQIVENDIHSLFDVSGTGILECRLMAWKRILKDK
jgi:hypothetical protein